MERNEITFQQSPRFIIISSNIQKYVDILSREYKMTGSDDTASPLLIILDTFTKAPEKESGVRTTVMDEPGVEYFNYYMGLHKTFMDVMLSDKFRTYDLNGYTIYLYNKLLMIEGTVYTLDQIKGFINHYTKYNIVQAPIEPVEDLQAFKIGCLTVSIQNIRNLVEFAEKEGDL